MPKIYRPTETAPEPHYLTLKQHGNAVHIVIVDSKGREVDCNNVLVIKNNGKVSRPASVNREAAELAGLTIDTNGRIYEVEL